MGYTDIKYNIDILKLEIDAHGQLGKSQQEKINNKLRLEWNYNSNSMEGNTLTLRETSSVMAGSINVQQKPYKDVAEIRGHDAVVSEILSLGRGPIELTEQRIKQIHKRIVHEEDEFGRKQVGQWKISNNYFISQNGEQYDFTDWQLVPKKMHDLLTRTNIALNAIHTNEDDAPHPLDVALDFYIDFWDIHPFHDGNGRVARILANIILISLGYPPFWVNARERDVYYSYLTNTAKSRERLLKEYMANLILRSQKMVLRVINGRPAESTDMLDKEIAQWKKQFEKKANYIAKSRTAVADVYHRSLKPLFTGLLEKVSQFDDLFVRKIVYNTLDAKESWSEGIKKFDDFFYELSKSIKEASPINMISLHTLELCVFFEGFKNNGMNTFNKTAKLYVHFEEFNYVIQDDATNNTDTYLSKKLYSEMLTRYEIKHIIKENAGRLFNSIKGSVQSEEVG
ncbi:Fic family protein [Flavobacterium zepuense]|nr:Fic family protein [Flavobacterium zepuense]